MADERAPKSASNRPACLISDIGSNHESLSPNQWRRSHGIRYGRAGVRKRRAVMKFASLENALMLATLVMFAVFLAWSVKIIVAWA